MPACGVQQEPTGGLMNRIASFEVGGVGAFGFSGGFAAYFFAGAVISVVTQHFAFSALVCTVFFVTAGS